MAFDEDAARIHEPHAASAALGISGSDYAARTQCLIMLITDLRALGAQADFNLPRIAVIGNQSVGKSSLVEAISGITLPRASGTCTRKAKFPLSAPFGD
ncbi:unnamed protein product [Somion occarium]|uniref:Dynamin N-terminal domain-containing protein n=1 Tax=Somion occarium TaxID=3059160 RepID=A0ABP1CPM3_9APHY